MSSYVKATPAAKAKATDQHLVLSPGHHLCLHPSAEHAHRRHACIHPGLVGIHLGRLGGVWAAYPHHHLVGQYHHHLTHPPRAKKRNQLILPLYQRG